MEAISDSHFLHKSKRTSNQLPFWLIRLLISLAAGFMCVGMLGSVLNFSCGAFALIHGLVQTLLMSNHSVRATSALI